jgi:hypothetical protein
MTVKTIPIRLIEPWRCRSADWRQYAAMMRAGDKFPPVQVIRQSSKLHGYASYSAKLHVDSLINNAHFSK